MSVRTRVQELNKRLAEWLCSRFVGATAEETTTDLIAKLSSIPKFLAKGLDIRPWRVNTTYPAYTDTDGTVIDPPLSGMWNADESVTLTSLVPSDNAWPHAVCSFNGDVRVSGARLAVDVEATSNFNLSVTYTSPNGQSFTAGLGDMAGIETTDLPSGRTSLLVNFGKYAIEQGHTNPPVVAQKYDLLLKATGVSSNYLFTPTADDAGGQRSFGKNNAELFEDFLMGYDTVDLDVTPYLYWSIRQPAKTDAQSEAPACGIALYTNDTYTPDSNPSAWYLGFDGEKCAAGEAAMYKGALNDNKPKWFVGEATGCVDLRNYISDRNKNAFRVNELKLYGFPHIDNATEADVQTECTFQYLFIGSAPTTDVSGVWGDPATPTQPLFHHAAVGGYVQINNVWYYVVGEEGASVTLKQLTFLTEQ